MKLWPVDGLLLNQQARANFDFAADTERIDALVSHGLLGMRPDHLPVIVLGTVIYGLYRLSQRVETEQVKASAGIQIGDIENRAGSGRAVHKGEF